MEEERKGKEKGTGETQRCSTEYEMILRDTWWTNLPARLPSSTSFSCMFLNPVQSKGFLSHF